MKKQNEKLANSTRTFTKDSKVKVNTNHCNHSLASDQTILCAGKNR